MPFLKQVCHVIDDEKDPDPERFHYVDKSSRLVIGPQSLEEIRTLYSSGVIRHDSLIKSTKKKQWVRYDSRFGVRSDSIDLVGRDTAPGSQSSLRKDSLPDTDTSSEVPIDTEGESVVRPKRHTKPLLVLLGLVSVLGMGSLYSGRPIPASVPSRGSNDIPQAVTKDIPPVMDNVPPKVATTIQVDTLKESIKWDLPIPMTPDELRTFLKAGKGLTGKQILSRGIPGTYLCYAEDEESAGTEGFYFGPYDRNSKSSTPSGQFDMPADGERMIGRYQVIQGTMFRLSGPSINGGKGSLTFDLGQGHCVTTKHN
jgi:hypothetical protein